MYDTTKTIYNIDLQQTMLLGKPYQSLRNTTLNDKFNILPNFTLPDNVYPTLKYFSIGNGGIPSTGDEVDVLKVATHTADHASLFNHIPFMLVKETADLSLTERAKYRLRKEMVINGIKYIGYYLKCIDRTTANGSIMKMTYDMTSDDKPTLSSFSTDVLSIINPKPLPADKYAGDTKEYLLKVTAIYITLTKSEFSNIKEAIVLLGGTNLNITELGLCSGHDIDLSSGVKESTNTQIMYHVNIEQDIQTYINSNKDMTMDITLGGKEPVMSNLG